MRPDDRPIDKAGRPHDVAAYRLMPITDEESAPMNTRPDWSDLADDTDWSAMFPEAAGEWSRFGSNFT